MSTTHKAHPTPHSTHPPVVAASINNIYGVYPGHTTTSSVSSGNKNTSYKMSSPQTTHTGRAAQPSYMLVPTNHQISGSSSTSEVDLANNTSWMVTTVIEDDDLMFGGKPLSAWYEEDRRRLSTGDEEEERRGRQRERVRVETHQHQHHHYHTHQQHQHHTKKSKEIKQ